MKSLDLFSGARGWDVPMAHLGMESDGVENWEPARATAEAAGFKHVHDDVRTLELEWNHPYEGLTGSPVCTPFSMSGKRSGVEEMHRILWSVDQMGRGLAPSPETFTDPDTALVLEPLRVIRMAWRVDRPFQWIALEQVPQVLPVWQAYERALKRMGYGTHAGILHAERYGVPQARRRAVLVARLGRLAWTPTQGVPWVSMREAIGRGIPKPSPTITGGGTKADHSLARPVDQPPGLARLHRPPDRG